MSIAVFTLVGKRKVFQLLIYLSKKIIIINKTNANAKIIIIIIIIIIMNVGVFLMLCSEWSWLFVKDVLQLQSIEFQDPLMLQEQKAMSLVLERYKKK